MDPRELETFFVRAHDRQLDDVPDTRCFRRFDGVDFELRLVQRVRPEQERLVAALERRPQRFRALVVDGGRFDSSRTRVVRFRFREIGRAERCAGRCQLSDDVAADVSACSGDADHVEPGKGELRFGDGCSPVLGWCAGCDGHAAAPSVLCRFPAQVCR
jgi:hypothetical protein